MVESQAAADVAFPSAASLDITSFVKNEYFICGNEINQSIIYRIFSMIVKRVSTQSGIKCVIMASAMRAKQGPCEPIKGCIREIREQ